MPLGMERIPEQRLQKLANIRAMTGSDDDLLYLELRPETRRKLLAHGPSESK